MINTLFVVSHFFLHYFLNDINDNDHHNNLRKEIVTFCCRQGHRESLLYANNNMRGVIFLRIFRQTNYKPSCLS